MTNDELFARMDAVIASIDEIQANLIKTGVAHTHTNQAGDTMTVTIT